MRPVFPQDGGSALGADDRVIRVLQHQHTIGHPDAERPAGAPLPDHDRDDGRPQDHHFAEINRDGLSDVAFFRPDARVRARRVDERHHGQTEFLGESHDPQRLPVTLGVGAAEIALDVFLHVAPFLVGDDHATQAIERRQAGRHRTVVTEVPVSVQFNEIAEAQPQIIQGVRSLWMARDFHTIPCAEVGVNLLLGLGEVCGDAAHLGVEIDVLPMQVALEVVQFSFRVRGSASQSPGG